MIFCDRYPIFAPIWANVAIWPIFAQNRFRVVTFDPEKRFQQMRTFLHSPASSLFKGDIFLNMRLLEIVEPKWSCRHRMVLLYLCT